MASKLSALYEMSRPVGMLTSQWRDALMQAKSSGRDFTAKQFYQWLLDAGAVNVSPNSTTGHLMRLVGPTGTRPDSLRPLVLSQAGRRGPGGSAFFRYAYGGEPGVAAKKTASAQSVEGEGAPAGDKNMAFKGSMAPEDKPYFDRRAQIQKQAQSGNDDDKETTNALAVAIDELEVEMGDAKAKELLAHLKALPDMQAATNSILKNVPARAQKAAMAIAKTMKGAGRASGVPVGPPSKRPGFEPGEHGPSKAKSALSKFMGKQQAPRAEPAPEPASKSDWDDVDLDDMDLGSAGAAGSPAAKKGPPPPPPKKEPEPKAATEPEEQDDDEGEFSEEPPEGEIPEWMPLPDHAGDRAERAMAQLDDNGIPPDDEIWQKIAATGNDLEANAVSRGAIPQGMQSYALSVAKRIFQMLNKEWEKSEGWKRAAYSRVIR